MATLALFLSLLLSSAFFVSADDAPAPDYSEQPPESASTIPVDPNTRIQVVIEGVVLCQDCSTRGTWSLLNSKPIQGAKVGITCRDAKNRPTGYKAVDTDENGYFYCPFDVGSSADYFNGEPTKACFVRLLSSPNPGCNDLTNINWGIAGAPVKFQGKLFAGTEYTTVVLEVDPISFRPSWCPISS